MGQKLFSKYEYKRFQTIVMNDNVDSLQKRIKQLFGHALIYGLTSSMQSVLGFIMLPILTAFYTPELFGIYSILILLSAISSSIFYLGASSALGRFYYDENADLHKKKIVTTTLIITFFGALLLVSLSLIFSKAVSL